jgi:hypothetical protein
MPESTGINPYSCDGSAALCWMCWAGKGPADPHPSMSTCNSATCQRQVSQQGQAYIDGVQALPLMHLPTHQADPTIAWVGAPVAMQQVLLKDIREQQPNAIRVEPATR